jgi:sugar O-acyltransferase (sialic acid O-acetyltransferase NeuD family)
MLIAGAGGHAIEILDILLETIPKDRIVFFDDLTDKQYLHGSFSVLKNQQETTEWFATRKQFCLGIGGSALRRSIYQKLKSFGGNLVGLRSKSAEISTFSKIDAGADVCKHVFISSLTEVSFGTLLNTGSKIHHHVQVGTFCEISPGVILLGGSSVGDDCFIGGGAIVLPKVKICSNVIIGAGTIVTKDIMEPGTYAGNPVRRIKG